MIEIITYLKKSNRYMHLIGGFLVGLFAFSPLEAMYAAIVAASCLELKDVMHGCRWDWTDWILTLLGGVISALIWLIIPMY